MDVPVDDGHALGAVVAQPLRGERRVREEAVAVDRLRAAVMARAGACRRSATGAVARGRGVGGGERRAGRAPRGARGVAPLAHVWPSTFDDALGRASASTAATCAGVWTVSSSASVADGASLHVMASASGPRSQHGLQVPQEVGTLRMRLGNREQRRRARLEQAHAGVVRQAVVVPERDDGRGAHRLSAGPS